MSAPSGTEPTERLAVEGAVAGAADAEASTTDSESPYRDWPEIIFSLFDPNLSEIPVCFFCSCDESYRRSSLPDLYSLQSCT